MGIEATISSDQMSIVAEPFYRQPASLQLWKRFSPSVCPTSDLFLSDKASTDRQREVGAEPLVELP